MNDTESLLEHALEVNARIEFENAGLRRLVVRQRDANTKLWVALACVSLLFFMTWGGIVWWVVR